MESNVYIEFMLVQLSVGCWISLDSHGSHGPSTSHFNHVCGVGESIPIGNRVVDFLNVEGIPLNEASYREFARVIRANGTICIRSPNAQAFRLIQAAIAETGLPYRPSRRNGVIKVALGMDNLGLDCPQLCNCRGTPPESQ